VSDIPPFESAPPPPPPPPEWLPWEAPSAGLGSLFPTFWQFVSGPVRAYQRMSLTADLVRPMAYFVLFAVLGVALGQFWRFVFWSQETSGLNLVPPNVLSEMPWIRMLLERPTPMMVGVMLITAPFINLIVLFIWALIVHVCLAMVGGAAKGFATTLRVLCYAQTASIAVVIPLFGGLFQLVWSLVLQIVGLAQAHRTQGGRAAFAVLLPIVLCCGCLLAAIVVSGFAVGNLLKQH